MKPSHSFLVASTGIGEAPPAVITSAASKKQTLTLMRDDPQRTSHFRMITADHARWLKNKKGDIEYIELPIGGETLRKTEIRLRQDFESTDPHPINKVLEAFKDPSSLSDRIDTANAMIDVMIDYNHEDSYKDAIALTERLVELYSESCDIHDADIQAVLKALKQEMKRIKNPFPYGTYFGATCQTFSSIAIKYMLEMERANNPEYGVTYEDIVDIYNNKGEASSERTKSFRRSVLNRGFILDTEAVKQKKRLKKFGLDEEPSAWPLFAQKAFALQPVKY